MPFKAYSATTTKRISVKRRPRTLCFCVVSALPRVSQLYRDHTTRSRALTSDIRHRDPYAPQQHDGLADQTANNPRSIQRLVLADEYTSVQIQKTPQIRGSRHQNLQTQTPALTRRVKNLPLRRRLQRLFRYIPMSCPCLVRYVPMSCPCAVRDAARTRRRSSPQIRDITMCLEGE